MGTGSSGGSTTIQQSDYEKALGDIASQYWSDTSGLRSNFYKTASNFLDSGTDPASMEMYSPVYRSGKNTIEDQYSQAKDSIMSVMPAGGGLYSALKDVESDRADSLGDLSTEIAQDLYDKSYGTGFGAVSQAMSGLGTASSTASNRASTQALLNYQQQAAYNKSMSQLGTGIGSMIGTAALGSACCFIFVEAHGGTLHPVVRRYRDDHMTARNRCGYYRLADRLVPLMRRHKAVHKAVEWLMVDPMTSYGKWFYGLGRIGWIFKPVTSAWLGVFNLLGSRAPYTRKGSGEVV